MSFEVVLEVLLSLIAVFMAIVLHEVAHGYVAARLGDTTARDRGRLTLNPLAHIDPIGTILVPVALAIFRFLFGWYIPLFGWAKPVPINPGRFRNPLRGMLYVALAGPGMNLLLAVGSAAVGRLLLLAVPSSVLLGHAGFTGNLIQWLFYLLSAFVIYNLILAAFNIIPIPPLDGSRILMYFLPPNGRRFLLSIEPYGFVILIAVLYLGGLRPIFAGVEGFWRLLLGTRWLLSVFT
jgi:Zn-dependent protease